MLVAMYMQYPMNNYYAPVRPDSIIDMSQTSSMVSCPMF